MNLRPSAYEADELPGCSTPHYSWLLASEAKVTVWRGKFKNFNDPEGIRTPDFYLDRIALLPLSYKIME